MWLTRDDLLGVGAIAIISCGAYFWGIEPVRVARAHAVQEQALLEGTRADVDARERELVALRNALAQTRERAKESISLSPASLLSTRLTEIPMLASRAGLKVAEIQPGAIAALERFSKLPIRFSGEGTYTDVIAFYDSLDRELPDIEITAFTIYSQGGDQDGRARFSADVVWYTLPEGGGAHAAAKAAQTDAGTETTSPKP
ncbi:MAG: type 4a pilus biogenesis protein PilO [Phycisphaerales bacterium]|jgi:Tfp pilus assembly protein PilO